MATANNTMKTRVQLKRDTEANWKKAVLSSEGGTKSSGTSFVPLEGELIIYLPDTTHDYSRLKVGDGNTNVVRLPFIDAGTINGDTLTNEIIMFSGLFPSNGDSTKLYVNTSTQAIYYYSNNEFVKLSNYTYTFTKSATSKITNWDAGRRATFTLNGGRFSISTGEAPSLSYYNEEFVQSVRKEGDS